jgi:hypothetical protein
VASHRDWRDSFLPKVRQGPGCWEWTGYTNPAGYGRAVGPDRTKQYVHRLAYQLWVGPIPDRLTVDHLCRNRACCNPAHLEVVTRRENIQRGGKSLQTHCIHGHSLADAYVDRRADGSISRKCRPCAIDRQLRLRTARGARTKQRVDGPERTTASA